MPRDTDRARECLERARQALDAAERNFRGPQPIPVGQSIHFATMEEMAQKEAAHHDFVLARIEFDRCSGRDHGFSVEQIRDSLLEEYPDYVEEIRRHVV